MIICKMPIELYSFEELNQDARQAAIEEHRSFLLDAMTPADFISGDPEYDTPEELRKQYNAEYDYYMDNDEPIVDSILANEYMFYKSGIMANVQYIHRHGERLTVLKAYGQTIPIKSEPFTGTLTAIGERIAEGYKDLFESFKEATAAGNIQEVTAH